MADAKDQKQPDLSRDGLFKSDAQLEKVDRKWAQLPSDEVVEKTKNALVAKGHKCDVVDNKEAALKLLSEIDLKDSSVYCAG